MTDPDGTNTRPSTAKSTSVVASNRSSTFAVPELSEFNSRTSISVPAGTSLEASDDVVVRVDGVLLVL
jgi:hypothetical protein